MWKIILCRSRCAAAILAVSAFLVSPAPVQTQFGSPVAVTTANLGFNGGTTGTINTTGANLLVACVSSHGYGATPVISDSKSNSWALAASSLQFQDAEIRLFYSVPTTVGSGHTFTISGSTVLASINVMAWADATASPLDQTAGAGVSATSIQPGSVSPTQNDELLISCLTNTGDTSSSSRSINGNFTIAGQIGESSAAYSMSVAGAYLVQTTATAANPTWSYSVNNTANAVIATFKRSEGAGGGDLASKPLFHEADLTYVGGFKTPNDADNETSGNALAFSDNKLFFAVKAQGNSQVMQISIPTAVNTSNTATMNTAIVEQAAVDITEGTINELSGDSGQYRNWGLLAYGGKLIGSAFSYYDANNGTRVSHFSHSLTLATSSFQGWDTFWNGFAVLGIYTTGFVSGPMADIPDYAQSALGGPVLATGAGNASIIGRLSWGHAAFAFDPSLIAGRTPDTITAYPLMYFTFANPIVVGHDAFPGGGGGAGDPTNIWNRATSIGGVVIPKGYRTALYFGAQGTGDYCYGEGTSTLALHGTLVPPENVKTYCYDPVSGGGTGEHSYPYRYQVWAFDLQHFAEVKAGSRNPWAVQPYSYWELTVPTTIGAIVMPWIGGVAYDAATNAIYVSQWRGDPAEFVGRPIIHKFTHP